MSPVGDLSAAAMVARGLCTAVCLIAVGREADACACTCRGRWHGALVHTPVPGSVDAGDDPRPPQALPQPGPDLLDELDLVLASESA